MTERPIATANEDATFALHAVAGGGGPVIFASPHSGAVYPPDMGARADLSLGDVRSAEDALADQLIDGAPDHGLSTIRGLVGRAYVDLNRSAQDLDPALIDGAQGQGPRVQAGYGVIARLTGSGQALYDRRLALAEAEARIARVHAPYHAALADLMEGAHRRFGCAVLIDWHSMPSRAAGARPGVRGADVVLGDRHGSAAARDVTRALATLFEQAGWRVALNHPYAGGYATQTWGRPAEGFHAVQVELNRALYLDEGRQTPGPGFARTRSVVARVTQALAERDWPSVLAEKKPRPRARP